MIRAIEYFEQTGEKISEHNEEMHQKESPYNFLYYVLTRDRKTLYERIDKRVDIMIANGLVKEIEKLKAMGCHRGQTSMQGLGYKEILDYLDGSCTLDEAVYILKRDTRHFAKRQLTWFRREKVIDWININEYDYDCVKLWIICLISLKIVVLLSNAKLTIREKDNEGNVLRTAWN